MGLIYTPTSKLPDGIFINGVAHFCRATNPTQRIDGSALQIGDKCYRTDLNVDTFWNGTYWLGMNEYVASFANTGTGSTTLSGSSLVGLTPVLVDSVELNLETGAQQNQLNDIILSFRFNRWHTGINNDNNLTPPLISSLQNISAFSILGSSLSGTSTIPVNFLLPNSWARSLRMSRTVVGTAPPAFGVVANVICRKAYL